VLQCQWVGAELGTVFAGPVVYCLAQQVFGYAVEERFNMNHYFVRHTSGLDVIAL
jgi:hypothetical protein